MPMLWLRGAQRGLPREVQAVQPVAAAAGCAGGAAAARERRGQLRGRVGQKAGRAAEVEGRRPVMGRVIYLPRALPDDRLAGIQMMTDPGWDRKGWDRHGLDRTAGGLHADRPGGGALRHIRTALRRMRRRSPLLRQRRRSRKPRRRPGSRKPRQPRHIAERCPS